MAIRIGVDVGGTFTDLVAWDEATGATRSLKVPTVPESPAQGVVRGLAAAGAGGACASVAHGTTIVTNAIVERRGAPTALLTTRGFRDVLEIARTNRAHLYRLDLPPKPEPLVPRRHRFEVSERIGPDGAILVPLDPAEIAPAIEAIRRDGIQSVAVCLLHAYANPAHERALRLALLPHFPHVSISSDVNAEFREYERTSTTVLNAAVMPTAAAYVDQLARAVAAGGRAPALHLLHSAGGMMSVAAAKARPLAMAMSGPAAGVAAAAHVARRLGIARGLAFDMGGTTTDVCLIADGRAETTSQRRLADYPVRLPMVAVESIGAGGGSIAQVDAVGALKVGPRSAGAVPGPVCYGQGGTEPTVTDANLVLGYLDPARVYGGSIRLDVDGARRAIAALGRRLGLPAIDAAHGVVQVANASMLRALRLVSVQRGYDLRGFALIAYGGAGPVHAGALARECGIGRVVVPANSGAFSALGCLVSPLRYDAVQTHRASLETWDAKVAEDRFAELEARCVAPIAEEGHAGDRVIAERSADLRYAGQNYEIEVPYASEPARLREAFEARHRQLYGYATGETVECVNLRVVARLEAPLPPLPAPAAAGPAEPVGRQRASFPGAGEVELSRYERGALGPGAAVDGPAIVEDEWSTIVVYPGQRATADRHGNLLIDVDGRGARG
jgi:N-methylhydantoinase A